MYIIIDIYIGSFINNAYIYKHKMHNNIERAYNVKAERKIIRYKNIAYWLYFASGAVVAGAGVFLAIIILNIVL